MGRFTLWIIALLWPAVGFALGTDGGGVKLAIIDWVFAALFAAGIGLQAYSIANPPDLPEFPSEPPQPPTEDSPEVVESRRREAIVAAGNQGRASTLLAAGAGDYT